MSDQAGRRPGVYDKDQILAILRQEFNLWDRLLAGMSEDRANTPQFSSSWSIKDVVAHLWAWQQRSIARVEAALRDTEPEFPKWPEEFDPEIEGQPHDLNAWIYETNRGKPWSRVYEDWREGFLRFLELAQEIPEADLMDPQRYDWLEGHPLSFILLASYEHHEEHRGWLPDSFRQKKLTSNQQNHFYKGGSA
jgi:hypothetical protein